jgi:hypothetical protein
MSVKVFISHSTKTEENKSLINAICDRLKNDAFTVLVDKDIKTGMQWFERLYDFMFDCNAAVILLSQAALENSEWVKAEAAILGARKRRNEKFELILVPLDGIKPEQIQDHAFFKVIRLIDFNMIRDFKGGDDLNSQLCDSLKGLKDSEKTPFGEMVERIGEILAPIHRTAPNAIERAFEKIKPDGFAALSDDPADSLARLLLRDSQHIFKHAKALYIELSHLLDKNQALRILDIIKGQWVHPEAAYLLINAHDENQVIAINSTKVFDFIGDCYAKKAWPFPKPYKLVPVNSDARTLAQIENTLMDHIAKSAIDLASKKRRLAKFTDPLLLVFPFPESNDPNGFPELSLLDDIKDKLKNVTVILSTGHDLPEHLSNILALTPLLDQTTEDDQYDSYTDVIDYIAESLRD